MFTSLWKTRRKKNKLYIPIYKHQEIYARIREKAGKEWCKNNPGKVLADMYIEYPYPHFLPNILFQYTGVKIEFSVRSDDSKSSFFVFDSQPSYTMFLLKWSP
jgi:hypothetical protein